MTETSSHRYKPRNIINAPNVKSSIFSRSQQRGDSENIQRWLSNHFYRWIIGDFPHVYPVRLGRQSFLHGSETLRVHRQINNGAACGEFGDFALRGEK